mgnify:FL=1
MVDVKYLRYVLLFAFVWFFGLRVASSIPDVFLNMVIGPFKTEELCMKHMTEMISDLEVSMPGIQFTKCKALKGIEL